jgi:predicted RNA-binding Zn-ribbon protein involved in translation (DUF1610 family)
MRDCATSGYPSLVWGFHLKDLRGSADRACVVADRETAKGSNLERGLEPSVFEARVSSGQRRRRGDLHVCPECGSDLVYPTDWAPASDRQWHVALRCPECEWNGGGRYSQEMVDRLDEALDRGTEAVLEDLNILVRANMEDQIDRFVAALNGDQILPEDF